MSADLLHEAADSLRDTQQQYSPGYEDKFEVAVADLLEHAARFAGWRQHVGDGPTADLIDRAAAVARAYLGADR
jgi:hypothetical protein